MKIETHKDPNFLKHDFKAPWTKKIGKSIWSGFLTHTFKQGDRPIIYNLIKSFITTYQKTTIGMGGEPFSLLEIGFGQCFDFVNCFKKLHDSKMIQYFGKDITDQFVEYAREEFINYKFDVGGFDFTNNENYDITYCRHVFEHQHPNVCYSSFENMLKATNQLSIVSWFCAPDKERFTWNDRDGFNNEGAYVNTYDEEALIEIINKNDFLLSTHFNKKIYYMRRK